VRRGSGNQHVRRGTYDRCVRQLLCGLMGSPQALPHMRLASSRPRLLTAASFPRKAAAVPSSFQNTPISALADLKNSKYIMAPCAPLEQLPRRALRPKPTTAFNALPDTVASAAHNQAAPTAREPVDTSHSTEVQLIRRAPPSRMPYSCCVPVTCDPPYIMVRCLCR